MGRGILSMAMVRGAGPDKCWGSRLTYNLLMETSNFNSLAGIQLLAGWLRPSTRTMMR